MKVGELIYDQLRQQYALIIDATACSRTSFMTVFYEDGSIADNIRYDDQEIRTVQ